MAGRNKFTATKGIKAHPYGDPTYLSFFFMFDWTSSASPLFNGEAEKYLRNFCGDTARADKLVKFKDYLGRINKEMPWFFQSIEGLNAAHEYGNFLEPYRGVDKTLTISCLETIDFTMAGLLNLYREVCYDFDRHVIVLPNNLREFRLYVHVQEIRNFVPFIGMDSATNLKNKFTSAKNDISGGMSTLKNLKSMGPTERKEAINSNAEDGIIQKVADRLNADPLDWKAMGMGPSFTTQLNYCSFGIDDLAKVFGTISNVEMAEAKHTVTLSWKSSKMSNTNYLTAFDYNDPDPLSPFDNDILNDLTNSMVKGAINQGATMVDSAAQGVLSDFKSKLLLGNVYGANTASKIQDVFNAGSINALGPLLSGDKTDDSGTTTVNLDGVYPTTPPEQPLKSTKQFEKTDPENPLSTDNVYPPKSQEQDSNLGNVNE